MGIFVDIEIKDDSEAISPQEFPELNPHKYPEGGGVQQAVLALREAVPKKDEEFKRLQRLKYIQRSKRAKGFTLISFALQLLVDKSDVILGYKGSNIKSALLASMAVAVLGRIVVEIQNMPPLKRRGRVKKVSKFINEEIKDLDL